MHIIEPSSGADFPKWILGIILSCFLLSCQAEGASSITIDQLITMGKTPNAGSIKERFGEFTLGHGPYFWYSVRGQPDKEVWFWWKPGKSKTSHEDAEVVLVTLVEKDNENEQTILWPEELSERNAQEILQEIFSEIDSGK